MDNLRLILFMGLLFVSMMLWNAWQQEHAPVQHSETQAKTAQTQASTKDVEAEIPEPTKEGAQALGSSLSADAGQMTKSSEIYRLESDVLLLEIDARGGTIIRAGLKSYPDQNSNTNGFIELLSLDRANLYTVQSGLLGDKKLNLPNHTSSFVAENKAEPVSKNGNTSRLALVATDTNGYLMRKVFEIKDGSYEVHLSQSLENQGEEPMALREYRQFLRGVPKNENKSAFIYTFTGGAWYSPENKFRKLDFSELEKNTLEQKVTGGWLAMLQHYFVGALVPDAKTEENFYSKHLGNEQYLLGYYGPSLQLAPKQSASLDGVVWLGPKLQKPLEALAPGLELSVDYGWLTVIAKPIYWLLTHIHELLGNWGWSIVVLTILIKLAFYKLSAASYKSMAGMRKLAPKLQAIKERYGEDKERFNKAMMELYQKEKINPLGGCLPILVQIPVFIALYWVLLESVEMRDAPFMFWITNLSTKDPYYVLPLIMGVTMFIQQKLNPAPPDPVQAKIMMSLPFIFTVFFAFFPSGLVLYWVVNNILSIAQQWYITEQLEKA